MVKRIVRAAALLSALVGIPAHADSCIWFADAEAIRQVQTSTNRVAVTIALPDAQRLAMNATDCGVWVLNDDEGRLQRFSASGAAVQEIAFRSLEPQLEEIAHFEVDAFDGSIWLGDARRLLHMSSSGQLLASFVYLQEIAQIRLGLDQRPVVLPRTARMSFFAVDELGALVWLADADALTLTQVQFSPPGLLRIALAGGITGFALDPLTGNLWVGQESSLLAYGRDGNLARSVDLGALDLSGPQKLLFDPASRSLWLVAERSVARFSDAGQLLARFSAADGDKALGVPGFKLEPTLSLVRPPPNALTNNARLPFTLAYGARCNGEPCPFANSYFDTYQLTATLNGQPVGSQFRFEPSSAQANFTPAARLPEGLNNFSAQVKDRFGHASETVTNRLTVDTIAPRFLTLMPLEGSVLSTPDILIQGTIDKPTASVVLAGSGLIQTGRSFSFPVRLRPGANTFVLSATDPAGNVATATLRLTLATVSISITSPSKGATINDDSVSVSGTFQGPVNTTVTVNREVAVISGREFFATIPLTRGANTISVTATAPNQQTATQTLSVTSTGPSATRVVATPTSGLVPLAVTFTVTSDRPIRAVEGNFAQGSVFCDAEGCSPLDPFYVSPLNGPLSFTYERPGVYEARFKVTHTDGTTVTKNVHITVQSILQLDQQLRQVWSSMTNTLIRGDKAAAMQYLNRQAQGKYGPVFDALLPNMGQIVRSFSQPRAVSLSGTVSEYAVNRTIDGVNRIFFIYLLRDTDGVWRIDSM